MPLKTVLRWNDYKYKEAQQSSRIHRWTKLFSAASGAMAFFNLFLFSKEAAKYLRREQNELAALKILEWMGAAAAAGECMYSMAIRPVWTRLSLKGTGRLAGKVLPRIGLKAMPMVGLLDCVVDMVAGFIRRDNPQSQAFKGLALACFGLALATGKTIIGGIVFGLLGLIFTGLAVWKGDKRMTEYIKNCLWSTDTWVDSNSRKSERLVHASLYENGTPLEEEDQKTWNAEWDKLKDFIQPQGPSIAVWIPHETPHELIFLLEAPGPGAMQNGFLSFGVNFYHLQTTTPLEEKMLLEEPVDIFYEARHYLLLVADRMAFEKETTERGLAKKPDGWLDLRHHASHFYRIEAEAECFFENGTAKRCSFTQGYYSMGRDAALRGEKTEEFKGLVKKLRSFSCDTAEA